MAQSRRDDWDGYVALKEVDRQPVPEHVRVHWDPCHDAILLDDLPSRHLRDIDERPLVVDRRVVPEEVAHLEEQVVVEGDRVHVSPLLHRQVEHLRLEVEDSRPGREDVTDSTACFPHQPEEETVPVVEPLCLLRPPARVRVASVDRVQEVLVVPSGDVRGQLVVLLELERVLSVRNQGLHFLRFAVTQSH